MIRLTKLTDYGVALMTRLARDGADTQRTSRDLSTVMNVPLPTVSKILKLLTRAGLLESRRGVAGGYSLARGPQRITLVDVITALEGPMSLTECTIEGDCSCELQISCGLRNHWSLINERVMETFENITLDQMAGSAAGDLTQIGLDRSITN